MCFSGYLTGLGLSRFLPSLRSQLCFHIAIVKEVEYGDRDDGFPDELHELSCAGCINRRIGHLKSTMYWFDIYLKGERKWNVI